MKIAQNIFLRSIGFSIHQNILQWRRVLSARKRIHRDKFVPRMGQFSKKGLTSISGSDIL